MDTSIKNEIKENKSSLTAEDTELVKYQTVPNSPTGDDVNKEELPIINKNPIQTELFKSAEQQGILSQKLIKENQDKFISKRVVSIVPKYKQQLIKWNGWGYKDCRFIERNRFIHFIGLRYPIGETPLVTFTDWVIYNFNIPLDDYRVAQALPNGYPTPVPCPEFYDEIQKLNIDFSQCGEDRLIRCHSQTLRDIYTLRHGTFARIPDIVIWPSCHDEVVSIVQLADKYNVVLLPFGGGTSVTGAATCPQNETRPMVAVDMTQMNSLLWLNKETLVACFEAGIIGQDLERVLREMGLTMGHEPDSYEFSTLGGWVATRASGMKKNSYGNIEDIVIRVKMVTAKGVLVRNISSPRVSVGPDFNEIILGSEGTLGIITEVLVKVRPVAPEKRYGSLVFPDFESGVRCLREIAKRRYQPSSIRLIDNEQFRFGHALKPGVDSWVNKFIDGMKSIYLTKFKGIDLTKLCVATLMFEGERNDVIKNENIINEIAQKYGGISGGAKNGERGYFLTFIIAYIRDFALEYSIMCESFETSVPWDRCTTLCKNVKDRVIEECHKMKIKYFLVSCRISQTYDAGACVYFYLGFNYVGFPNPVDMFEHIEDVAREEILESGGSLSHHHGIGKVRRRWFAQSISEVGINLFKATKHELDPKNIFAIGNLVDNDINKNPLHASKL